MHKPSDLILIYGCLASASLSLGMFQNRGDAVLGAVVWWHSGDGLRLDSGISETFYDLCDSICVHCNFPPAPSREASSWCHCPSTTGPVALPWLRAQEGKSSGSSPGHSPMWFKPPTDTDITIVMNRF